MKGNVGYKTNQAAAIIYLSLGIGLAVLATHFYLSSYYQAIVIPTLLTPIFFGLALWRWQTANQLKNDPAALLALFILGVFLLFQPETLSDITQWHWVGLCYPLLAFYLLPTSASLAFSLLLLAGLLNLRLYSQTIEQNIVFSGYFLLIIFIAWCYVIRSKIEIKKLENLIGIDKETGFFNTRHLNERLNAEVSRARLTKKPLSLLLVELHQYPAIQQELGKRLARNFIREASSVCRNNCRIGDEAYRYDNQTLLILMPNTTINGSLVLRTRLYQNLLQELACDIGPLDTSITPLELHAGEQVAELQARLLSSCYHSLSERVVDNLDN